AARRLAVLFPGQASQHVGMATALRSASPRVEQLFGLAESITGLPLGRLCAEGPLTDLTRTDVAQTAVVTASIAAAWYLEDMLGTPVPAAFAGGHSVGELTAMCWADAISVQDTLRLVHRRGELMARDAANCDGTMAAVIGIEPSKLETVCQQASVGTDGTVQVANLNGPGQIVISGDRVAVGRAAEAAVANGARRVLPLNVGGPFHSRYMVAAARDFSEMVESIEIRPPRVPVILNTSAELASSAGALRSELPLQITRPVRWHESVDALVALGCDTFLEIGPGDVLCGLVRRIAPKARVLAVGSPDAAERAAQIIRACMTGD